MQTNCTRLNKHTAEKSKGFAEVFRSGYLRRTLGVKVLICLDAVCPLVDFIWFHYLMGDCVPWHRAWNARRELLYTMQGKYFSCGVL